MKKGKVNSEQQIMHGNSGLRNPNFSFAFFGTSRIAVGILLELERAGFTPAAIVATPDAPKGRGLELAPPPTKTWAQARGIEVLQPEKLHSDILKNMRMSRWDVFIVVDYGKLLPQEVLDIPKRGALNVHFSLLPRYRGASPIRSAILADDSNIGTSIILLTKGLDEGPVVAQKPIHPSAWPMKAHALENLFIHESGLLLAQILPAWVQCEIEAREQNHDLATYCEKIEKQDGLLDLHADGYQNLLKIRAYEGWPSTYTFFERNGKKIRAQIIDAHLDPSTALGASGTLVIDRIKPEGKREMSYEEFLRSGAVLAK